ncbi:MAG: hypothetical protein ABEI96_03615 [Haloarculaceae archaeon]
MQRRYLYGGLLAGAGLVLAILQVWHGLQQTDVLVAQLVDVVPFAASGLAVTYTGVWLAREDTYEPDLLRIVLWAAGGALAFAAIAALLLFGQEVTLGTLRRASYVTVDNVTVGTLSGVLVGLYDAQSRERLRDLQDERDRVEEFARKAADVNNYGRAINRSTAVEEIAAYTIEGVETLTGFYETVFLDVTDDRAEVVGSTWVDVDDETVAELATRAVEQTVEEAVFHTDDLPASLRNDVEQVLTTHVTSTDDRSIVFVSVGHSSETVAEEDVQLLELLVSHAGTALDGLYTGRISREVG